VAGEENMKRLLLFCLPMVFLVGCGVSISYEVTDPNTGKVVAIKYNRTGDQKVSGASVTMPDGTKFTFESSESAGMAEAWDKTIDVLAEVTKKIPTP